MARFSKKAGGNINPARFVKLSTTADNVALIAGAGEVIFGVSQPSTRRTPYSSLDDGYAAIDGEDLDVYGVGERPMLELGATVTAGARLKSDASGKGTPVTSNNDEYGAVAQVAGVSGELIEVLVVPYGQYGA